MIIVTEGISAAGKTTFSRQFGEGRWLPEMPVKAERPWQSASAEEHAVFWADHNAARFQMALDIERKHGFGVCDTDPLKIHYSWCMEKAGFDWPDHFALAAIEVRQRMAERRLGFADLYLVKQIDDDVARAQKENDNSRRRDNFEEHLALQPHLIAWFAALSDVVPDRVRWSFPEVKELSNEIAKRASERGPHRYDTSVFDALIDGLPR
ncbi:hypothetical protein [Erythrobacter crassostreae]|uniref:Uncharacterized protein n=1 Tax=Erythrobacter crassostreae TaxID=2828328 RepID=A0A9X1F2N2_9SPHN|nr:hypothetical protein [Erythrobacter crassostrea]MBV7259186.1 hypothetical protein [Erythrobacter crassostrea]